MSVRKRGDKWYYDFGNHKYRGVIPEARTKHEAQQAEVAKMREVFDGTYGATQMGTQLLGEFVKDTYLPWAKTNKRTWRNDEYIASLWCERFRGKTLREISPLAIEKHKRDRANSTTKRGTSRSAASVNMELCVLSRIFTLAVELEQASTNPCRKVKKMRVSNRRERYLSADEEALLMAQLTGRRAHLAPIVQLALGTGMRRSELLRLTWSKIDFGRNVIHITQTKTDRDRQLPISPHVRQLLLTLRRDRKGDFVIHTSKGKPVTDVKRGFRSACADAGIDDFRFHDLRHTFAPGWVCRAQLAHDRGAVGPCKHSHDGPIHTCYRRRFTGRCGVCTERTRHKGVANSKTATSAGGR
jgi:integrase